MRNNNNNNKKTRKLNEMPTGASSMRAILYIVTNEDESANRGYEKNYWGGDIPSRHVTR